MPRGKRKKAHGTPKANHQKKHVKRTYTPKRKQPESPQELLDRLKEALQGLSDAFKDISEESRSNHTT